ncbi:MAG: hypothetical protein JWO03_3932 [Bacteroidetes bacterium]|nr:hypothetical protein [Bacteroidota bacterium]
MDLCADLLIHPQNKQMRKLLFLLLLLIAQRTFLSAQEIPLDLIERATHTDYIFEGIVLKTEPYKTLDEKNVYTSNVIQITKIFKGDLSCGTIELITIGGALPDENVHGSHCLELKEGSQGIFLCNATTKELPATAVYAFSLPDKMEATYEWQSFIKYVFDDGRWQADDLLKRYDSIIQLYHLAELITQIQYTDCGQQSLVLQPPAIQPIAVQPYQPRAMLSYNANDFADAKRRLSYKRANLSRPKAARSTETLNFRISNVQVTGTSPKYLEYDVNVFDQSNVNHFLSDATIRLVYDPAVFGSYLVTNNKITVTNGALANSSCYFSVSPNDDNPSTISMLLGAHDYSICKSPITASPQQLVHISMEIQTCGLNSKVAIQDTSFFGSSDMAIGSGYSLSSGDSLSTSYDLVTTDSVSVPSCKATITSFDPPVVNGGVGDILSIRGFQFGSARGSGNLYFYNSNHPQSGMSSSLDNVDYLLWSDTLIQIVVPSKETGDTGTLGTGTFRIVTNANEKDTTANPLTVYYSVINEIYTDNTDSAKSNFFLENQSGSGGYFFHEDTSVSHNPGIAGVVRKAIKDWVCATGVNFTIVGDTTGVLGNQDDRVNVVTMGPQSGNHIATCYFVDAGCINPVTHKLVWHRRDIDVVISNTAGLVYFTDTTGTLPVPFGQVDLYHVLLHELGHGVGLNHVIDSTLMMYYRVPSIPTGGLSPAGRVVHLAGDLSSVDGGTWEVVASHSSSNVYQCATPMSAVSGLHCEFSTYIEPITQPSDLRLYPNPFDGRINIASGSEIEQISLTAVDGKVIYNRENVMQKNTFILVSNELAAGVYILSVQTKAGGVTQKIVHVQN